MNSCTEGCVMWSQHLRRWEGGGGQRRKKLRVPMDQKKEKGKRRSGHRRRENKDDQKGPQSRKCRKDESSKRKRQNRIWATTQNRTETERKEGRKQQRERDEWGRMRAGREGSQEDDIRAPCRNFQLEEESGAPGLILSPYKSLLGQVCHVGCINQQVDGCQDGHSQSLVPHAHQGGESVSAAPIAGPLGLDTKLLIELVEKPEDQAVV